mgnify:CR=1 FL=1
MIDQYSGQKFSYPLMFVTIIGTAMHWMDIYILGLYFDNTTVGMYHPAARTAGLLRMILVAFMGIFSPMIAELYAKNSQKEFQHFTPRLRVVNTYLLMQSSWLKKTQMPNSMKLSKLICV